MNGSRWVQGGRFTLNRFKRLYIAEEDSEKVALKLNIHVHMDMGRREERVRYVERLTWKLTLPYVK